MRALTVLTDPTHATRALPALAIEAADASTPARRWVLRHLDDLLGELEQANLEGAGGASPVTCDKLSSDGLSHPEAYTIPELIEIVFQTQRRFLRPPSGAGRPAPWGARRA
ncbi:MAG: hypothetical protein J2P40_00800 [Candidatus Dormibacteraeota bacterium]|nr:hypothetical protein [Candidatus Dormibacteraeota bacterium]MBO0759788.1 hypothetical protein [Candidatus Dormibacteraeota bacterium]